MTEVKKDPGVVRGMKAAGWKEYGENHSTGPDGSIESYQYYLYHKTRRILADVQIDMNPDEDEMEEAIDDEV